MAYEVTNPYSYIRFVRWPKPHIFTAEDLHVSWKHQGTLSTLKATTYTLLPEYVSLFRIMQTETIFLYVHREENRSRTSTRTTKPTTDITITDNIDSNSIVLRYRMYFTFPVSHKAMIGTVNLFMSWKPPVRKSCSEVRPSVQSWLTTADSL
jgi:hypothetical protein